MSQTTPASADLIRERFTGRMNEQQMAFIEDLQGFIEYAVQNGLSFPMLATIISHDVNELFRFGFDMEAAKARGSKLKTAGYSRITPDSFGQGEEE